MEIVNILWTGGWDSTYRVFQLSKKEIKIQPYYIKTNRPSTQHELDAIKTIKKDIQQLKNTKCVFKDLIIFDIKDVKVDQELINAHRKILQNDYIGNQYPMLTQLTSKIIDIEMSIHIDDTALVIIQKYGKLVQKKNAAKNIYYQIDPNYTPEHINLLFAHYTFPITDVSKLSIKKEAEENGFINIMNKTWFCYHPINNEPCGKCNPCKYTIQEGLKYRFSKEALKRYQYRKFKNLTLIKLICKIYSVLKN